MSDNPYDDLVGKPREATAPSLSDIPLPPTSPGGNPYDALVGQRVPQPKQRKFNEPFGELRPAEYSPSERMGNAMQDALIAGGAQPYVAGRVARGAQSAASFIPPVGAIMAGADTGYHAQRGDPFMAGVSALGMVPGYQATKRAFQGGLPQRALAPEEEQLRAAKKEAYDAWRQAPVTYSPGMMDDAVNEITRKLIQEGADPATKQAALNIGTGLKKQTGMTNNDFEILRKQLSGGKDATDIRAGEIAKDALENYLINPPAQHIRSGTPQEIAAARENLLAARGNAAAEFRSRVVGGKENAAEIAAERGREFTDKFRDQMGNLVATKTGERAMRGFSQAERDRVRDEVAGSLLERTTGRMGEALNKYSTRAGLGIGGAAGAAPWLTGGALGLDPITAIAAGAGIAAGGKIAGKGLQEYSTNLARRSADELGAGIRMRSPEAQAYGSPYGYVTDPNVMMQDARRYLMYPALSEAGEDYVEGQRVPYKYR